MYAVFEQSDLSVCDFCTLRCVVVFLTTECLSASEKKTVCVSSLSCLFEVALCEAVRHELRHKWRKGTLV